MKRSKLILKVFGMIISNPDAFFIFQKTAKTEKTRILDDVRLFSFLLICEADQRILTRVLSAKRWGMGRELLFICNLIMPLLFQNVLWLRAEHFFLNDLGVKFSQDTLWKVFFRKCVIHISRPWKEAGISPASFLVDNRRGFVPHHTRSFFELMNNVL